MSISGGDGGLRGRLTAHDAKTTETAIFSGVTIKTAAPQPGNP